MELREVIANIDDVDDELTIYVRPKWTPSSAALVLREPDAGGLPEEAQREEMTYFLEVSIARQLLGALQAKPLDERVERVIQYATHDA